MTNLLKKVLPAQHERVRYIYQWYFHIMLSHYYRARVFLSKSALRKRLLINKHITNRKKTTCNPTNQDFLHLVSSVHMTFYVLRKGYTVPGTRVPMTNLTRSKLSNLGHMRPKL